VDDNCDKDVNQCKFDGIITLSSEVYTSIPQQNQSEHISVATCDVNNDGTNDLLIGLPDEDKVSIYIGPITKSPHPEKELSWIAGSDFGSCISCATMNLGVPFVAIGSASSSPVAGALNAGTLFVFHDIIKSDSADSAELRIDGTKQNEYFGSTCKFVPDLTKDSEPDLFIGAQGYDASFIGATLFFDSQLTGAFTTGQAFATLVGEYGNDLAGSSIATAYLDQDDEIDFVVGAYLNDYDEIDAGRVYLFTNLKNGIASLNQSTAFINGVSKFDHAGFSICSGMDFTGDEIQDIVVGAPGPEQLQSPGKVYILSGDVVGSVSAASGVTIHSEINGAILGYKVACDDLNGDGIGDILISAPLANYSGQKKSSEGWH
jgi:hypothetical protein